MIQATRAKDRTTVVPIRRNVFKAVDDEAVTAPTRAIIKTMPSTSGHSQTHRSIFEWNVILLIYRVASAIASAISVRTPSKAIRLAHNPRLSQPFPNGTGGGIHEGTEYSNLVSKDPMAPRAIGIALPAVALHIVRRRYLGIEAPNRVVP